jgi:hypothetical protein
MNKIISLVTAFKKFKGVYDRIQTAAMYSWKVNDLQVIAPVNEVDTKTVCQEYSYTTLIEGVKRGRELGYATQSPILKDLIKKALPMTKTSMVAFLNSDIILLEDFSKKIERIFDKYGYDIFITGTRYDIQLNYRVNDAKSYEKVQHEPRTMFDTVTSSDIFITSKFLWRKIIAEMPEFILGRYCWDNWLHLYVHINKLKKFNCTQALPVLHPIHGNEHIYQQEKAHGKDAPSSQHNLRLWTPFMEKYGTASIKNWPAVEI